MPRCIPDEPVFTSAAEQQVWQALRASLRPHDVLMANLRVTDADGDHEADIVVGMPDAGIVVVEVKGGKVSHDGQRWRQGRGEHHLDPVTQARKTKYALRGYLDRDPRWARRRTRFVHAVAFPHSAVASSFALPECPRSMVLDRDDLPGNPAGRCSTSCSISATRTLVRPTTTSTRWSRCSAAGCSRKGTWSRRSPNEAPRST